MALELIEKAISSSRTAYFPDCDMFNVTPNTVVLVVTVSNDIVHFLPRDIAPSFYFVTLSFTFFLLSSLGSPSLASCQYFALLLT